MQKNNNILGILGGGQLGRMFTQAAQAMGYQVCVLDPMPKEQSPAASIANFHICANYNDEQALTHMSNVCFAISTEFENVPAAAIDFLSNTAAFTAPNAFSVSIAQNRIQEKLFFSSLGLNTVPFHIISCIEDIYKLTEELDLDDDFFPAILKTTQLGYDGKGQISIYSLDNLHKAWQELGNKECILEKRINIHHEISVVLGRDRYGNIANYPIGQNVHKNGILFSSTVPSPITPANVTQKAYQQAKLIAENLNYMGVFCVEFFVLEDETIYINEIAPRPHNSGHYTQNACVTSQFEQQVRILAGLPLGSTIQHSPVVMLNILGDSWFKHNNEYNEPNWQQMLQHAGVQLHLYGKNEARSGRKMGHINCVSDTLKHAQNTAQYISELL
jgi:5-(carboxyamino)imidazole ribonucleotide synthase